MDHHSNLTVGPLDKFHLVGTGLTLQNCDWVLFQCVMSRNVTRSFICTLATKSLLLQSHWCMTMFKMWWQRLIPSFLGICLFAPAMFILFKLPCKHAYQDFISNHIESSNANCTINSLSSGLPAQVPCQIWALWDQGFENAPRMQKTCLWSHKAANPTFNTSRTCGCCSDLLNSCWSFQF